MANNTEYQKNYRQKNKNKIQALQNNWKSLNYSRVMWHSAKERARKLNLDFNLDPEDIKIPIFCPYLQVKLTTIVGQGNLQTNASLDRVDSAKGYTKDNIEVVSNLANKMKNCATKEQLITFSKSVLKRYEDLQ